MSTPEKFKRFLSLEEIVTKILSDGPKTIEQIRATGLTDTSNLPFSLDSYVKAGKLKKGTGKSDGKIYYLLADTQKK